MTTPFISVRTRNGSVKKIDDLEKKMSELLVENSNLKDEVDRLTSELNEEKEKSKQQQHQIELMQKGYSIYYSHTNR